MKTNIDAIIVGANKAASNALKAVATAEFTDERARKDIKIDIEKMIEEVRDHPKLVAYYASLSAHLGSAISSLGAALTILDGELYDYYMNDYHISLKTLDIKHYITHDERHRRLVLKLETLREYQSRVNGTLKAFEARGYSLNSIVKLLQMRHDRERMES